MFLTDDKKFMTRALKLAELGKGYVSPNPMVGCVLVKDGSIIGEGYHEKFGGPHAEIIAIRNSKKDPSGSTAYITLEPCCITGKTPPCTKALIDKDIQKVYIAMLDPNPLVNGKGVNELKNAGIPVHTGILHKKAQHQNKAFTKWITTGTPWVSAKIAQSANGYMGIDSEKSVWLTGEKSQKHAHQLRTQVDAIMVGRQTALVDNPKLTARKATGRNPKRIVADTNCTLPMTLYLFQDGEAETIILCSEEKFEQKQTTFCKYISTRKENGYLSPEHILQTLGKEGITSLLIEGGHKLINSFKQADLIDEVYVYTAPDNLENAELKNPIQISSNWKIRKDHALGSDHLIVAEKRKEKCLQEL
ncbi:MAG: bifunctional diaminohydroxyphosphoribosylaminopyrimidine deaminase/5-amino-6-(5-phosphoribosylamino)uracil reductase RibD [Candidatus Marinimicrobia bacterium]|jgi:diaminohydroxyphosphoribosylaminopyrimidine deaminase/5-amino-6-(5-phosphoribosylamino)uracil reductase|nr:bifunctional diaminohydroxyphosphoribosylaminopyrimidine deaminase/5-amino-6-(5-phosphoribosylamino)uracil reductase RibD [Candidatus Neomarinimicrobiota bacterium]